MISRAFMLVSLVFIFNMGTAIAQHVLSFGVVSGFSTNTFFYSNNTGSRLSKTKANGTIGFALDCSVNHWLVEGGAFGFYSNSPHFIFNVENGSLALQENPQDAVMDLVYLPIRVGYIIPILKGKMMISPKMGVGLMHSLNGAGRVYTWADGVADLSLIISGNIPEEPGVTVGYGYRPYKNSMAFDASISLSFNLHKFLLLNFNIRTIMPLRPIYYESIKHFGETHTVFASSTQVGPITTATLGFAFAIPFSKEPESID
jgi:hypothetical protein